MTPDYGGFDPTKRGITSVQSDDPDDDDCAPTEAELRREEGTWP